MTVNEFVEETKEHIDKVKWFLFLFMLRLGERATAHDASKMEPPEDEIFRKMTPLLKGLTYDSPKYRKCLDEMGVALVHHYQNNRHHPEHHTDGIKSMNLVDVIEMFCDWQAATMRHDDGDILASIEKNQKRFGYSDELKQILLNTVDVLDEK